MLQTQKMQWKSNMLDRGTKDARPLIDKHRGKKPTGVRDSFKSTLVL